MRALCIDSEQADAALLEEALVAGGASVDFKVHDQAVGADAVILAGNYDVVFLEYQLDQENGLDILRTVRGAGYTGPIIMVTSHGNEYVAAEATRAGADQYLAKQDLRADSIMCALARARIAAADRNDASQLRERIGRLELLSRALAEANTEIVAGTLVDGLTGLLNRGAWEEVTAVEHTRAQREASAYSILMIDLDRFKLFNESAGTQAGDECIRQVARSIPTAARPADVISRFGGEGFAVLLPAATLDEARLVAVRILDAVRELRIPHPGLGPGHQVTVSIGASEGPLNDGWEATVGVAENALRVAKADGREQIRAA